MKTRSSKFGSMRMRINRFAPVLSILLMVGASFLMANPVANDAELLSHRARIVDEMAKFPYRLGQWVGEEVPVPTTAVEILRPNALVSRRYSRLETADSVVLALIHCNDLRDMLGHYPPVCYPATGWTLEEDGTEELPIRLADTDVFMRLYRFHRFAKIGLVREQAVLSMFLLPDGRLLTDMEDLKGRSTQGRSMSATGVAQLQIVFADDPTTSTVLSHANEILTEVPQMLVGTLSAPIYRDEPETLLDQGSQR